MKRVPCAQFTVDDAHVTDDAAVRIELRVEHERAQMVAMALRRRNALDDRLENVFDADALFRARENALALLHDEQLFDFAHHALGIGGGQIDLVDHRNDRQIVFERQMVVRQRLRFDALRRVDNENRALACRKRTRDLVRKVDVPRRVDQIQLIDLPVFRAIVERDGMHADRDPALALQVHRIERLLFHVARFDGARQFQQAIRERRLAVIDVRDDAEVADVRRDCPCGAVIRF